MNENQQLPDTDNPDHLFNQDSLNSLSPNPQENLTKERKSKNIILVAVLALLFLSLGAVGMYLVVNSKTKLPKEGVCTQDTKQCSDGSYVARTGPNCDFAECPIIKEDPTADWKTYTNSIEKFSFKYPSTWAIDKNGENGDEMNENIHVILNNEDAVIYIAANIVGIGGIGRNFEGDEITLDGHKLYKFKDLQGPNNRTTIGITRSLEDSIGVFEVNNKTYDIHLNIPNSYNSTKASELEEEFNQILATFKFGDSKNPDTTDWKTYTNKGISFKYPTDWVLSDFSIAGRDTHHGLVVLKPGNMSSEPSIPLQISYWDNPNNLTLQNYHNLINENAQRIYPLFDSSARMVFVSNQHAFLTTNGDCSPSICDRYVIPYIAERGGGKIWELFVDKGDYKEMVEKIIETVSFTD